MIRKCVRHTIYASVVAFIWSTSTLYGQILLHSNSPVVQIGAGMYDVRRPSKTSELQIQAFFPSKLDMIRPMAGIMVTGTRDMYASVGLGIPIRLSESFVFLPSFGGGVYKHGKGTELGYVMEFRSDIEVSYQLINHSYIGIGIYHFSNGSLSKTNPGLESLLLSYSFLP